jgi:hypothetical protein
MLALALPIPTPLYPASTSPLPHDGLGPLASTAKMVRALAMDHTPNFPEKIQHPTKKKKKQGRTRPS